jgi:hypothetical protein
MCEVSQKAMVGKRKQLQLDEAVRGVNILFEHLCSLGDIGQFHNIACCTFGCE